MTTAIHSQQTFEHIRQEIVDNIKGDTTTRDSTSESIKSNRILSLSGGGVKGIAELVVLAEIEERTGKSISELFSIITGTSVGGLIGALLTIPKEQGSNIAKYSAKDALKIFTDAAPKIFEHHWYDGIKQIFTHKHSQGPLKEILEQHYQTTLIATLDDRNRLIEKIKENVTDGKPFEYDIIMNTEGYHCTPVHLTFDKDKLKIFTIDAADAPSITYMQFLFQLEDIKDIEKEINAHSGSIQKDNFSCAIFSIQDLNTMSKLGSTLGEYLPQIMQLDIAKLHPRFVKNAQSIQTISNNLAAPRNSALKVSKNEDLKEYTNKYSINIGEQKKRNYAITYKTLKYLNAAQKELNDAFKSGGNELVKNIIRKRTGGIIFEESKYNFNNIKMQQKQKDNLSAVERLNASRARSKSPQPGISRMGR